LIDCTIPPGWTGTTPQKTLQEVCRKKKLGQPKFSKLPASKRGYRLKVNLKKAQEQDEWIAYDCDFVHKSSVQDYLALQALYGMDSTVPMYRMFPPTFRDIWLSWLQQIEDAQNETKQEETKLKQARIDRLITVIKETSNTSNTKVKQQPQQPLNAKSIDKIGELEDDMSWEGMQVNDDLGKVSVSAKPTANKGEKLKEEFIKRQSTAAYKTMVKQRQGLPMTAYRQQILESVQQNPVVILCAETVSMKYYAFGEFMVYP
jgi:hypothetical protein